MSRPSACTSADNYRSAGAIKAPRDLGNTLIVVEHDEDTMCAADLIVDVGPGAGVHGGSIVAAGPLEKIIATPESITGQYLSGVREDPCPGAAAQRQRALAQGLRLPGEQSAKYRRRHPLGDVYLRDRRFRLR